MMTTTEADIEFVPPAQDKNLDMVRNILFGEQNRETERRLATLERFVRVWTNSVRDEVRKSHDALHHEIHLLHDLLAEESRARLSDATVTRKNHEQANRGLDALQKQIQINQENFNQRLEAQREDILSQLKQASDLLHQEKADKRMLAALLNNVTRQLAGETG